MACTPNPPDPDDVALLSKVLRDVARRRLPPEDADDFVQAAELKLLERGHDVLARFSGRSALRTYLHVVASRMVLDWRNTQYGKWRPSAAASRLGPAAVLMDRLISRDGCTPDEAAEIAHMRWPETALAELRRMAGELTVHPPRRLLSGELGEDLSAVSFEDPVEAAERAASARTLRASLRDALGGLSAEDRWLIRARYRDGRSVQAIACVLGVDPKQLYRRYERMLAALRDALDASGVTGAGLCDTTTTEA